MTLTLATVATFTAPATAPEVSSRMHSAMRAFTQPGPVMQMSMIVIGLLVVATIILAIVAPRVSPDMRRELWLRTRSWWVMVALSLLAITVNQKLTIFFIAMLSFVSLKEFFTLVHMRIADRRAILLAYLSVIVQYYWIYTAWERMFIIFIPVYMFLIISFRLVVAGETQRFMTSAGKLHWGLMAFAYGISHLAGLLILPLNPEFPSEAGGRGLLFFVVFLAEFNDVLQFLFGKAFGRHKMTPHVSPNKTWEGFLGGLICTSGLAVLIRFLTPMDVHHALLAGMLIAITGPIGGMIISAIKRDVGVKDSGTAIPGHGGVLDRVDSLCFSAPIFFHFMAYFYGG